MSNMFETSRSRRDHTWAIIPLWSHSTFQNCQTKTFVHQSKLSRQSSAFLKIWGQKVTCFGHNSWNNFLRKYTTFFSCHFYYQPIFLNEVMIKKPADDSDSQVFHLHHVDRIYSLKAVSNTERYCEICSFTEADLLVFNIIMKWVPLWIL